MGPERPGRNLKLVIQYEGSGFAGSQVQPNARTVQGELDRACRTVFGPDIALALAGRTDAGVHALGQVAGVKTGARVPTDRVAAALNSVLPEDMAVVDAAEMPADFHPRYSARGKVYRYTILNRDAPSPFLRRYAWHVPGGLDLVAMRAAGEALVGQHDFTSFCAAQTESESRERELRRLEWECRDDLWSVTMEASGFLWKMARTIVGTLVEVGVGRLQPEQMSATLSVRDRRAAGPTAPAHGLCLIRVIY
jgi:tRNA pseudouridine38-40 synthase